MKGSGTYESANNKDRTVLYSDEETFLKHVSIVDLIMKRFPEIEESFGSPIISGGRVKNDRGESKYAISAYNPSEYYICTQNSFFDRCVKTAIISLLSKKLLEKHISLESIDLNYYSQVNQVLIDGKELLGEPFKQLYAKGIEILQKDGINQSDINKLRENIKKAASYIRFKDFSHTEVPIYMDRLFYNQFCQIKKETNPELNKGERPEDLYLFQTENLVDVAIEECLNSPLSNKERVIIYITRINEIFRKFEVYSRLSSDFRNTQRYFEVQEYYKSIPVFGMYVEDPTKGNGINMVLETRYYDEVFNQIASFAGPAR